METTAKQATATIRAEFLEWLDAEHAIEVEANEIETTRETLNDWRLSALRWRKLGGCHPETLPCGAAAIAYIGAQAVKGQPKQDIYIVDAGELRLYVVR